MFVDWTDPQKAMYESDLSSCAGLNSFLRLPERLRAGLRTRWSTWTWLPQFFGPSLTRISSVSAVLAFGSNRTHNRDPGSDKKVLCQALSKLYLPPGTDDDDKVRTLKLLVHNLRTRRPPRDASAVAALSKFDDALSKQFEKQLEDFNEAEYRQLQSLQELFEFLDDIMPLDEDEEEEATASKKRGARKRRSVSVTTDATSMTDEGVWTPPRGKSGKARSKCGLRFLWDADSILIFVLRRRRTSQSDDDDAEDDTAGGSPPSEVPTRSMPRRAA